MTEKTSPYFGSIEWLRFFAALGIVWFHTDGASWRRIGYSGLPIFLLVFCTLIVVHYSEISFNTFLYRRSVRLLVPWVFWSSIYGLAKVFKHFFVSKEAFGSLELNWLLIGGSIHLWYLLFAFLASILLYYTCRYTLKTEIGPGFIVGILCLGILALYCCSFAMGNLSVGEPFQQWLFALPCLPIGFCLGVILRRIPEREQKKWLLSLFVVIVFSFIGLMYLHQNVLIIPYSLGLLLTILSLQLHFPFETAAVKAGKLTYGIYLIHPLIASLVNVVLPIPVPFIKIIVVFTVSLILVYLLKKTIFRCVL